MSQIPIYIEIPVEKIVEKRVPVEVEKVLLDSDKRMCMNLVLTILHYSSQIVIKEVMIPVEKIIKKIIEKENIIEVTCNYGTAISTFHMIFINIGTGSNRSTRRN